MQSPSWFMSKNFGQECSTEHVARFYSGVTCAMGSGMGSSRMISSHLYPVGSSTKAITLLPPFTGPASLLTFPPGKPANLNQFQLTDAKFNWISQLQALFSKVLCIMMQAGANSTQAGF